MPAKHTPTHATGIRSRKDAYHWISDQTGISHRDVKDVLRAFHGFLLDAVENKHDVAMLNFGRYILRPRKGRVLRIKPGVGYLPAGDIVQKPTWSLCFKPGVALRRALRQLPPHQPKS
jgi:nucleoid DNA-binding protein